MFTWSLWPAGWSSRGRGGRGARPCRRPFVRTRFVPALRRPSARARNCRVYPVRRMVLRRVYVSTCGHATTIITRTLSRSGVHSDMWRARRGPNYSPNSNKNNKKKHSGVKNSLLRYARANPLIFVTFVKNK